MDPVFKKGIEGCKVSNLCDARGRIICGEDGGWTSQLPTLVGVVQGDENSVHHAGPPTVECAAPMGKSHGTPSQQIPKLLAFAGGGREQGEGRAPRKNTGVGKAGYRQGRTCTFWLEPYRTLADGLEEGAGGRRVLARTSKEDAEIEIRRYEKEGYVRRISLQEGRQQYKDGTISRLGLVLKVKESGEKKRRVVIDLRRSGGNSKSSLPEKLVLPRPVDVMRMLKEMNARWPARKPDDGVEFAVVDVMDAFTTLPLHREEHRHALSPSTQEGQLLLFQALLFGYRTAPLLYSRFASMIARLLQSGMDPKMACHQVYLDDSLWAFMGSLEERSSSLAMVLYTMMALKVKIALQKGSELPT